MVALSTRYDTGPVRVDVIGQEQGISLNYIHVLMGGLKAAGLVRSVRGASGGYEIARNPAEITAFEVVSALEGQTAPVDCVTEPGACARAPGCPTRAVWCRIANCVNEVLMGLTLKELAEHQTARGSTPNYCI